MEVALGEPLGVRVVRADAGHRHQTARRPVQVTPHGVGVTAAQQRGGLRVEEADDARARRDAARLAVHQLVVRPGRAQHLYVGDAHARLPLARDVRVLRRVLPLPHGHHGRCPGHRGRAEDVGPLLFVGAPQRGGALHEARQRGAVRHARFARRAEPDVVQRYRPVQPGREDLADQVGHLAARALTLQPTCHGGVFVPQCQASRAARLVHMGGEARVGDARLVEQGVEQGIGLHGLSGGSVRAQYASVVELLSHGV